MIYNLATIFSKTARNNFPMVFFNDWPIDDMMIDKWPGHYHNDKKSFTRSFEYLGNFFGGNSAVMKCISDPAVLRQYSM